jgi:hypothetical protein
LRVRAGIENGVPAWVPARILGEKVAKTTKKQKKKKNII